MPVDKRPSQPGQPVHLKADEPPPTRRPLEVANVNHQLAGVLQAVDFRAELRHGELGDTLKKFDDKADTTIKDVRNLLAETRELSRSLEDHKRLSREEHQAVTKMLQELANHRLELVQIVNQLEREQNSLEQRFFLLQGQNGEREDRVNAQLLHVAAAIEGVTKALEDLEARLVPELVARAQADSIHEVEIKKHEELVQKHEKLLTKKNAAVFGLGGMTVPALFKGGYELGQLFGWW